MKYTGTAGILYDRLKSEIMVADGAFGTYYAKKYDTAACLSWQIYRLQTEYWQFIKNILNLVLRLSELIHLQVIPCVLERDLMR